MDNRTPQLFGGDWTQQKLDILKKYLHFYTTALRPKGFRLVYIDAFAGTGYRELKSSANAGDLLFPDLAEEGPQRFLAGSARIALESDPKFHEYVFLEKSPQRAGELEVLRHEFGWARDRITVELGDANESLKGLCRQRDWHMARAVLFLDPFGLQVEWSTLREVAATQAIDVWILFPLSVNRLLTRDGRMMKGWADRITKLFGTDDWFDHFYGVESEEDLFGPYEKTIKTIDIDGIIGYWQARLKSIFADVAENPKTLENTKRSPLFLLCFAVGNPRPKAKGLALKVAHHILES